MGAAPLPLVERIRVAGFNVMIARASYDIWWLYKGAAARPLYIDGMQTYSEFFRFDEEAHFRAMIVGLCSLFDGRSSADAFYAGAPRRTAQASAQVPYPNPRPWPASDKAHSS